LPCDNSNDHKITSPPAPLPNGEGSRKTEANDRTGKLTPLRPGEGPGVRLLYNVSSIPRTRKFLQPVLIAADTFSDTLFVLGLSGFGVWGGNDGIQLKKFRANVK
jgi:hypothetical protein